MVKIDNTPPDVTLSNICQKGIAGVLSTAPHNALSGHGEHWVAIRGIITDKDPTVPGNTSVELKFVWFNDPSPENLGDCSIERLVTGSVWYGEFQPVNKAGSVYNGKYVAVMESSKGSHLQIANLKSVDATIVRLMRNIFRKGTKNAGIVRGAGIYLQYLQILGASRTPYFCSIPHPS